MTAGAPDAAATGDRIAQPLRAARPPASTPHRAAQPVAVPVGRSRRPARRRPASRAAARAAARGSADGRRRLDAVPPTTGVPCRAAAPAAPAPVEPSRRAGAPTRRRRREPAPRAAADRRPTRRGRAGRRAACAGRRRQPSRADDATEVHIHIGRIDVTAVREAPPPAPPAGPALRRLDVARYLPGAAERADEHRAGDRRRHRGAARPAQRRHRSTTTSAASSAAASPSASWRPTAWCRRTAARRRRSTSSSTWSRPTPAGATSGLPSRDASGRLRLTNAPLALDLHYLLSAYSGGDLHAEILLGYAMQLLHEMPVLTARRDPRGAEPVARRRHQPAAGAARAGRLPGSTTRSS